jgi:putative ABC transport system permease protein
MSGTPPHPALRLGIGVNDPLTFGGVALLLLAVATVASVAPAGRILRLDPATTRRQE